MGTEPCASHTQPSPSKLLGKTPLKASTAGTPAAECGYGYLAGCSKTMAPGVTGVHALVGSGNPNLSWHLFFLHHLSSSSSSPPPAPSLHRSYLDRHPRQTHCSNLITHLTSTLCVLSGLENPLKFAGYRSAKLASGDTYSSNAPSCCCCCCCCS